MKILVLSNTPWSTANSFGNSFSNIFGGIEGLEFANIFCKCGQPDNNIVKRYFQITEKSLLKNLINNKHSSGRETVGASRADLLSEAEEKLFNHARGSRLQIYFWVRDLIWKIGRWESPALRKFIVDFDPDIIFQPVYYSTYLNDIAFFIEKFTKAPMVCYVSDDVYTLRQFSLSPLYWINRFMIRAKVKKVIEKCKRLYVISDIQKKEYEKCFKKECFMLTKGADFSGGPFLKEEHQKPLKLVYTGNIGTGRWRSLALLGRALNVINAKGMQAQLYIYTMTPITNKIKKALSIKRAVLLLDGRTSAEVERIQRDADILVHVESFGLKGRLQVHQSLSTKIVDYFAASRCIFAVGSMDTASIDYLAKNDAAVIATSEKEIFSKINQLVNDPDLAQQYAEKAWECGRRNHQIGVIQSKLYKDLASLVKETQHENPTN